MPHGICIHGHSCFGKECRAWSKVDKECEFILAARAFKRLGKTTRPPAPPGVQT